VGFLRETKILVSAQENAKLSDWSMTDNFIKMRVNGSFPLKFIQYVVTYTNKDGLRAATLAGYAKAITHLFTLWGFPAPVNPSDPNNMGGLS